MKSSTAVRLAIASGVVWGFSCFAGLWMSPLASFPRSTGEWMPFISSLAVFAGLFVGMLKCDLVTAVVGISVAGVITALTGRSELFAIYSLAALVALFGGAYITVVVDEKLDRFTPEGKERRAGLEKRNPRCASCHAKGFCPKQPGGVADAYGTSKPSQAVAESVSTGC